jgi:hypothetical protein
MLTDRQQTKALCGPRMPGSPKRRNAAAADLRLFDQVLPRRQGGVGGSSSVPRAGGVAEPVCRHSGDRFNVFKKEVCDVSHELG